MRPYIQRKVGTYRLLDDEGLSLIEANAETILAEIGMEFRDDPEVLEINLPVLLESFSIRADSGGAGCPRRGDRYRRGVRRGLRRRRDRR